MKKTILTTLILIFVVLVFAGTKDSIGSRSAMRGSNHSRTEIIFYQEDFEDGATDWTTSSTLGTNLWHIEEVTGAPSPTHAMVNQNDQNTYNPNMQNYLISPSITLPFSGDIKADFMMSGSFDDPNNPPSSASVTDYWYWDISPNNGSTWYRMSNPYNDPNGINYVFIDAPDVWSSVDDSYSGLDGFISDYAGMTVKFRICFRADADTPIGTGIMIDNFTIYNDVFLPEPSDLSATIAGQTVELNWTAPPSGFSTVTITSTNSAWTSYLNDADAYAMKIENPFTAPLQLHGIKFMLYRPNSAPIMGTPTLHVFEDDQGLPGNEIASVTDIMNIPNYDWKMVDITSQDVYIPASGAIYVGISGVDGGATDQGLLADSTSVTPNSFALFQGMWDTLTNSYTGLRNCALGGVYWVDDPFAPILTGFKVYRSTDMSGPFDQLAEIENPATVTYTDSDPQIGEVNYYYVTGLFDTYESDPSNMAQVDLIGLLYTELLNDDGVSDQNFNLGASASSAVKFTTQPNAQIHYSKIYLNAVGNSALIIRIYDANGDGGTPGTMLLQYTAAVNNLAVGWNNLPLPTANIVTDPDGVFYIAVMEYASAPTFALDTDTSGDSWKKITTSADWEPITEGNVMIRALVNWGNANDDYTEVVPVSNLMNYPNPFNTNTEFYFDMQKDGKASLKIYNLKGQLVRNLADHVYAKGAHVINWDGTDNSGRKVGLGVYFGRLEVNGAALTRKIVRIR